MHETKEKKPVELSPIHQRAFDEYDALPDSVGVPVQVAAAVMTASTATVWRRIADKTLDVVRVGGTTRVTVGSIRRAMTGEKPSRMARVTEASVTYRATLKAAPAAAQ